MAMPQPNAAIEQPRPDLRDALYHFDLEANQQGFVGLQIAPALEVAEAFGQYKVVKINEILKDVPTDRAADGSYRRVETRFGKASYAVEENGMESIVDYRTAKMFRNWTDAEMEAAELARDQVIKGHNKRVIAAALAVSTTTAAGTAWTTHATADPRKNIREAAIKIRNRTGMWPDSLVIDREAVEHLVDCDKIIDRIKYSGKDDPKSGNINESALAQSLGVKNLIVSGAVNNSANEMAASASLSSMWDRTQALLFRRSASRRTAQLQFMRTLHWGADGSQVGGVFETYYDPSRRAWIVRNRMDSEEKLFNEAVAERITGVLA